MNMVLKSDIEFYLLGLDYEIVCIQHAQTKLATLVTEVNNHKEPIICLAENDNEPKAVLISYKDFTGLLDRLDELDTTVEGIKAYQEHLNDSSGAKTWDEVKAELLTEEMIRES